MVVYIVSQRISVRALKCSKQILSHELSPIVCSTSVSSHGWKAFRGWGSQAFPCISLKTGELLQKLGVWNFVATFLMCTNGSGSMFFNSLMEMTSGVAWYTTHCRLTTGGFLSWIRSCSSIVGLVNTACIRLPMLVPRSLSFFRTKSADLWSLKGSMTRTMLPSDKIKSRRNTPLVSFVTVRR